MKKNKKSLSTVSACKKYIAVLESQLEDYKKIVKQGKK